MVATATNRKLSLDERAKYARNKVLQQLLYHFGRAIPDLDQHGEAYEDMRELTDLILEAAELGVLQKLQTKE